MWRESGGADSIFGAVTGWCRSSRSGMELHGGENGPPRERRAGPLYSFPDGPTWLLFSGCPGSVVVASPGISSFSRCGKWPVGSTLHPWIHTGSVLPVAFRSTQSTFICLTYAQRAKLPTKGVTVSGVLSKSSPFSSLICLRGPGSLSLYRIRRACQPWINDNQKQQCGPKNPRNTVLHDDLRVVWRVPSCLVRWDRASCARDV